MSCQHVSDLGPALALDALEAPEREALEAHLRRCPRCADELRELREVAAHLGLALPQHEPPPALGQRILALAAADVEVGSSRIVAPPPPSGRSASWGREERQRRPPWYERWSPAISLASLVAAIAALLWGASLQAQLGSTQRQLAETSGQFERVRNSYGAVVRVLGSPQTRVRELEPTEAAPAAEGKLWVDQASGQGMLMARDLPRLPEGQTYQVWLSGGGNRVSAGFLRPSDEDVYYVVLQAPGKLTDYERLGVTREPAGGSPGPTGPRVIGGQI